MKDDTVGQMSVSVSHVIHSLGTVVGQMRNFIGFGGPKGSGMSLVDSHAAMATKAPVH